MTFWIVVGIVVVVGLVLAWRTSRRTGPEGPTGREDHRPDQARAQSHSKSGYPPGGLTGR